MAIFSVRESKTNLSTLIQKALAGEEVIIANAGKPVVKLVPIEQPAKKVRQFGGWEGQIWMADDFDAPLGELNDYM
ncbi:MAG TPA: type II toxin-antitoxin system Phd/YefM family antitoxin [Pseudomonadota bacterium]|nr:type II toxin-antitoxin system Phd/YefM family antitoxin [Pseudomonadota bacterium]